MAFLLADRMAPRCHAELRDFVLGGPAGVPAEAPADPGHSAVAAEGENPGPRSNPGLTSVAGHDDPADPWELSMTTTDIPIPTRRTQ
jgi:hypothetical protein